MNRLIPILVLWGLLASVGVWHLYTSLRDTADELQAVTAQYEAQKKRILTLQADVAAAHAKAANARMKLKEALDASPEFRDTPVPDAVRNSLCSTIVCK